MTEQVDPSSSTSGPLATVPDADEAIERLRQENAKLRAELASLRARQDPAGDDADWEARWRPVLSIRTIIPIRVPSLPGGY